MKVLIACDKFKGSLDALGVCQAIAQGITAARKETVCTLLPMADGGDGTLQVLKSTLDLRTIEMPGTDALGRAIRVWYLSDGETAFLELAVASGLAGLREEERNPLHTQTVGTGRIIQHALETGHSKIVLGLGGSATNDAGMGLAYALGFQFLDQEGKPFVPTGGNLSQIRQMIPPDPLPAAEFLILCDVDNPLYGPTGAAHTYGPQKGANPQQVELLDQGLRHLAALIQAQFGREVAHIAGGGAAGGIAAGLSGLLPSVKMQSGFDYLQELTGLEEKIAEADWVITGEGKLDEQSLAGKVVGRMAELCRDSNKPLLAFVGRNELSQTQQQKAGIRDIYEVMELTEDEKTAMASPGLLLTRLAYRAFF
ncbi:MAG: glycerate kinase [Bacteroidota bacterium]